MQIALGAREAGWEADTDMSRGQRHEVSERQLDTTKQRMAVGTRNRLENKFIRVLHLFVMKFHEGGGRATRITS